MLVTAVVGNVVVARIEARECALRAFAFARIAVEKKKSRTSNSKDCPVILMIRAAEYAEQAAEFADEATFILSSNYNR